jgi:predicted anti-sigma-YlaC factor YlaD
MDCAFYREAISAGIDGEDAGLESTAVEAHLAGCPACRRWARSASLVTRAARVAPAERVPDLTTAIMAAVPARRREPRLPLRPHILRRPGWRTPVGPESPLGVVRLALVLVGLAQVCLAVPGFLGDDAGAPVHIAHEQGVWALALAVGLLMVAWRPRNAAALLPFMAVLAGGLALTMAADIAAGRTQAAAEAPHGLAFLGVGLLWVLAHPIPARRPRRGARPA